MGDMFGFDDTELRIAAELANVSEFRAKRARQVAARERASDSQFNARQERLRLERERADMEERWDAFDAMW